MRIGIAQINAVLGDFEANGEKILRWTREAAAKRCSLVVFPECALFGYHPFDLLEREELVDRQLKELERTRKKLPDGVAVIVGLITKNPSSLGRPYYNSAAVLTKNAKPKIFHKTLLPTGDVFDEARFIEQGDVAKNTFTWKGRKFLLTICEDIWAWPDANGKSPYKKNPLREIKGKKFDLIVNLSASPWYVGKMKAREWVTSKTAAWFKAPLLYVNMVGGQDEIIFDGRSFLIDGKGKKYFESLAFDEQLNVVDLKTLEAWAPAAAFSPDEELRQGLVMGLRDFCTKIGMEKVHLGLSGGIDSAVVACLAVDALGPSRVSAYAMPGPFSAPESVDLARTLAKNLGIAFGEIPIKESYDDIVETLSKSIGLKEFGVVHENIQARLRGMFLMAIANRDDSMLLTTGNKSEYATGYSTLYGDMCGGLAPIGDLVKDQVYALAKIYNEHHEVIPNGIIDRAPSAELRSNQKDQDTLPPYKELDQAVIQLVERCAPARGKVQNWVEERLHKTEFKRWQAPPILKASAHSFGRGRRYPLAYRG